jgi:hypothetical protein
MAGRQCAITDVAIPKTGRKKSIHLNQRFWLCRVVIQIKSLMARTSPADRLLGPIDPRSHFAEQDGGGDT